MASSRDQSGIALSQQGQSIVNSVVGAIDGATRLLRLADLGTELCAEPVAEEARELAARVSEGRFYVACVGQAPGR